YREGGQSAVGTGRFLAAASGAAATARAPGADGHDDHGGPCERNRIPLVSEQSPALRGWSGARQLSANGRLLRNSADRLRDARTIRSFSIMLRHCKIKAARGAKCLLRLVPFRRLARSQDGVAAGEVRLGARALPG